MCLFVELLPCLLLWFGLPLLDTLSENRMLDIWKGQIVEKAKGVLEEFDEQDNNAIASMSEFSVRSLDLEISALERMQFEESLISVLILYQGSDQFSITTCEQCGLILSF